MCVTWHRGPLKTAAARMVGDVHGSGRLVATPETRRHKVLQVRWQTEATASNLKSTACTLVTTEWSVYVRKACEIRTREITNAVLTRVL